MTTTFTQAYEIPDCNLSTVEDLVEKLNRKARKYGLSEITLTKEGMITKDVNVHDHVYVDVVYHQITISGHNPMIDGFQFVASIDHITEEGNVINVVPGMNDIAEAIGVDEYREAAPDCDHCHVRRMRTATYVLYNENTNERVRIGRSCLAMYFSRKDVHDVAKLMEDITALDHSIRSLEDEYEQGEKQNYVALKNYLQWVALAMRLHGWTSKARAYEDGTLATAYDAQNMQDKKARGYSQDVPSDQDKELVEKALTWIRSANPDNAEKASEYLWNLYTICKSDIVFFKHQGIAASLLITYKNAMQRAVEKKHAVTSQFVGTEKGKLTTLVTVTKVTYIDGQYGTIAATNMIDAQGNKLVWFNSGNVEMAEGHQYQLTGTVKEHKADEKYGKSTVLTRCKVKEIERAA